MVLNLGAAVISSRQSYFGLAVLIALVGLVWLQEQEGEARRVLPSTDDGRIPAYYFKGLSVVSMDQQGEVVDKLETRALNFFSDDGSSQLEQPILRLFRQDKGDWLVASESAKTYGNWDSLWLEGDVAIKRLAHKDLGVMEIKTEDLWLYPNTKYAETQKPVSIINGLGSTQGEGMSVDLAKGQVQLLSAVQGTYVRKDH